MEQFKQPELSLKLKERINIAKQEALRVVSLYNGNPSFSEEEKKKLISKAKEDLVTGARFSSFTEEEIKTIERSFDVEVDLLTQGLEEVAA